MAGKGDFAEKLRRKISEFKDIEYYIFDTRNAGYEGELINRIQNLRKDSGFEVTDKIEVIIFADEKASAEITPALGVYMPQSFVPASTMASVGRKSSTAPNERSSIWRDFAPGIPKFLISMRSIIAENWRKKENLLT